MRTKIAGLAIGVTTLALVGCSSGGGSHPIDPATVDCHNPKLTQAQYDAACGVAHLGSASITPSTSPASSAASSPDPFTYPDGAKVAITKAQTVDSAKCDEELPQTSECIFIELSLTNTGQSAIVFGDSTYLVYMEMYFGPNQSKAETGGYQGDTALVKFPRQCVPGSTVTTTDYFEVPRGQDSPLMVAFKSPLAADDQTFGEHDFENVQTLIQ